MEQIWQIIPNLTSPLAVLSFAFYVFYLYKRSEDEKKEKSLLVSNSDAQRIAAEKILNEYPDLKIDSISDPNHAVELAKQIIADKLKKYNKTLNTLLWFTIIFAVTFLISLYIPKNENDDTTTTKKSSLDWGYNAAVKNRYPFSMPTVIQHIKIRDITDTDSTRKRIAEFRDYYTLIATRDIKIDENLFEEQYLTSSAKIFPWAGSEKQEIHNINTGIYWVKYEMKKNETKTFVTGANYHYTYPLTISNVNDCFDIKYENDEWLTCYPNTRDYIDNLIILIETDGIDISLPPISMYKKSKDGNIITGEGSCKVYYSKNCTLVAKWEKISPGECVGFKIKWK